MLPKLLQQLGLEIPSTTDSRPLVGVSACLLGRRVRYDGGHRYSEPLQTQLGTWVRFTEICPEVAIGLPIPRPPIQVVRVGERSRVLGVDHPEYDYTDALARQAQHLPEALNGFVFKARSPSCGLGSTPVHNTQGQSLDLGDGAFAAAVAAEHPDLPKCEDTHLESRHWLQSFTLRTYCHRQWQYSRQPNQTLDLLRQRSKQLNEPLLSDIQHFIDHLAAIG